MNYQETVAYIEGIGKFDIAEPLEHAKEFMRRLGNPQDNLKVLHVAGTNGKGSVCAFLASMLQEGGYSCGLFTSPHLVTVNERFRVNGRMITDEDLTRHFKTVKDVIDEFLREGREHPSYFEIMFAVGMLMFREQNVDYAVLETGLGGKLDATNTVKQPLACVITSISLDHTEILGDTIAAIAAEKAGIIKPGVPVVYDGTEQEAAGVIEEQAVRMGSPAYRLNLERCRLLQNTPQGLTFLFDQEELFVPYAARYQMINASLAWYTMELLENEHRIDAAVRRKGLAGTSWEGRMEMVLPGVILDGAHNEDGIHQFIETAVHFKKDYRITVLFSAVADKRYRQMIAEISGRVQPDAVIATQIEGSRIVPAGELADEFRRNGCRNVTAEPNLRTAWGKAQKARGNGLLFCVGSLYLVGEIKKFMSDTENAEERAE